MDALFNGMKIEIWFNERSRYGLYAFKDGKWDTVLECMSEEEVGGLTINEIKKMIDEEW